MILSLSLGMMDTNQQHMKLSHFDIALWSVKSELCIVNNNLYILCISKAMYGLLEL